MSSDSTAPPANPPQRCRVLLKLAVVIAVICVGCAIATPFIHRQLIAHRAEIVANDLQGFKKAFRQYALAQGSWPAATSAPGEIPAGMTTLLQNTPWPRETHIGGRYTWDLGTLHRDHYYTAAISIRPIDGSPVSSDREQLLQLDRKIDDGDLATGRFFLGFHNFPVYVLEP